VLTERDVIYVMVSNGRVVGAGSDAISSHVTRFNNWSRTVESLRGTT